MSNPVNPANWIQGRSAATRLTALARSEGICERGGENPVDQVHHKNRMKPTRTLRAKVMSDKDQQQHAVALCQACHLETHHGNYGEGGQTWLVGTPEARKRACPVWGALDGNLLSECSKAPPFDSMCQLPREACAIRLRR